MESKAPAGAQTRRTPILPAGPLSSHSAVMVILLHEAISPEFTHSCFQLIFFLPFLLLAKDSPATSGKSHLLSFIFICKGKK